MLEGSRASFAFADLDGWIKTLSSLYALPAISWRSPEFAPCLTASLRWRGRAPTPSVEGGARGMRPGSASCEGTAGKFRFTAARRDVSTERRRTVGDDGARARTNDRTSSAAYLSTAVRGPSGTLRTVWESVGRGWSVSDAASDRAHARGPDRRTAAADGRPCLSTRAEGRRRDDAARVHSNGEGVRRERDLERNLRHDHRRRKVDRRDPRAALEVPLSRGGAASARGTRRAGLAGGTRGSWRTPDTLPVGICVSLSEAA